MLPVLVRTVRFTPPMELVPMIRALLLVKATS